MKSNNELLKLMLQFSSDFAEVVKLWGEDAKMIDQLNKDVTDIYYESNAYVWPTDMTPKFLEASFLAGEPITKETFTEFLHDTYFNGHTDVDDDRLIEAQVDELFKDLPPVVTNKQLTEHLIETRVTDETDKDFFEILKDKFYNDTLACKAEMINNKSINPAISEIRFENEPISNKLASMEYEMRENASGTHIKASTDWSEKDKEKLNLIGKLYLDYETQRVQFNTVVKSVLQEHPNSAKRMLASGKDFILKSPNRDFNVTRVARTQTDLSTEETMKRQQAFKHCKNEKDYEDDIQNRYTKDAPVENFAKEKSLATDLADKLKAEARQEINKQRDEYDKKYDELKKKFDKAKEDAKEDIKEEMDKISLAKSVYLRNAENDFKKTSFYNKAADIIKDANMEIKAGRITLENIGYMALGNTLNREKALDKFKDFTYGEKVDVFKTFIEKREQLRQERAGYEETLDKVNAGLLKGYTPEKLKKQIDDVSKKEKLLRANRDMLFRDVKPEVQAQMKQDAKDKIKAQEKEKEQEKDKGFERTRE